MTYPPCQIHFTRIYFVNIFSIFSRIKMSRDATTEISRSSLNELLIGSIIYRPAFLETRAFDADYKALKKHLVSNTVFQSDLDICLLRVLRIVQRKERELSHVAPVLTLLLHYGAVWKGGVLLAEQKTPYHIICESPGDHHELLDSMIKSSQRRVIDTQNFGGRTALMHAVQNANINCLKCLIANGAIVNISNDRHQYDVLAKPPQKQSAILEAIRMVSLNNKQTSVNEDIFDLLLDKSPSECYMSLLIVAADFYSVYCIKKLIETGANPSIIGPNQRYVWPKIARIGNVELLKTLFKHGIDKDSMDENGISILWYVVDSDKIEAVRFLLDLGVTIPTYTLNVRKAQCEQCKENTLIMDDDKWEDQMNHDPCIRAVSNKKVEIVKLLDEHGGKSCRSFSALRYAVRYDRLDVVSYLLNKYTYPLNMEYITYGKTYRNQSRSKQGRTLLTETNFSLHFLTKSNKLKIIKLLLDHGADPVKSMCAARSANAVITTIAGGNWKILAQYLRSGIDVNVRSYDHLYGAVLPFEASVQRGYHDVAEMLLMYGCSCGVFSLDDNHEFKNNLKPGVEKLVKEWKVQENNVIPLQQRCRSVILNHLSPRADLKIEKLPLPGCINKFLCIPELDNDNDNDNE